MLVPIDADGEWYEIEMRCVRREYWWVLRGGECDGDGTIRGGNRVVVVKSVVCE